MVDESRVLTDAGKLAAVLAEKRDMTELPADFSDRLAVALKESAPDENVTRLREQGVQYQEQAMRVLLRDMRDLYREFARLHENTEFPDDRGEIAAVLTRLRKRADSFEAQLSEWTV